MRFNATVDYPGPASQIADLLSNRDFTSARFAGSHSTQNENHIATTSQQGFEVTLTRFLPREALPSQAQGFLANGVQLRIKETWLPPQPDGSRDGDSSVDVVGLPAQANGTYTLQAATMTSASLIYQGDVKVNIPLFGARVEQAIVDTLEAFAEHERDLAVRWLTQINKS